jgi:hypothetical protein
MIRDKVAVLGPNAAVKLLAPASLLTKSVVHEAGEKNVAGTIVGSIFSGSRAGSGSSNRAAAARYPSAQHAAAAAELVLAAVAKAGRNRGRVTNALRRATIAAGALGPLRIERGDPAPLRSAGTATPEPLGIQIAIAAGTSVRRTTVVRPLECLVRAALDATTDNAKLPPGCRP